MLDSYRNIITNSPEEFYELVKSGYGLLYIFINENKKEELFTFLQDKQDDPVGQCCLSMCYYHGYGTNVDYDKTTEFFMKSVENEFASALDLLGVFHHLAREIRNNKKAFKYISKAAALGSLSALYHLSECYFMGIGVKKDQKKAFRLLSRAAHKGEMHAQYKLREYYLLGEFTQFDFGMFYYTSNQTGNYDKALMWCAKAARKGFKPALQVLGRIYYNGEGGLKDYQKSLYWYKKGAKLGMCEFQYQVGTFYENGLGVEQDYKKAVHWYKKAAKQLDGKALYALGNCYEHGLGVVQNDRKACYCYLKARNQGIQEAEEKFEKYIKEKHFRFI